MTNNLKCMKLCFVREGGIYTELAMGAGRPTNGSWLVEMTVEHGRNSLFPFFTGWNNNSKELLDLKNVL